MPFVRDMVDAAMSSGGENIVVIINNDIKVGVGLGDAIKRHCSSYRCYWAFRIQAPGHQTDGGADLFAFTREWWESNQALFPDLLLGYRWWDAILIRLMFHGGCPEGPRLYFHEPHPGVFQRNHTAGASYNERLGNEWCQRHGAQMPKP